MYRSCCVKMKCLECGNLMKEVEVKVQDSKSPVISYQCGECGYFDFEKNSINRVIDEISS